MGMVSKKTDTASWNKWIDFAKKAHNGKDVLKIAVIGKYFETGDFLMNLNNFTQCFLYMAALLLLVKPLGLYMAWVYDGERMWIDKIQLFHG